MILEKINNGETGLTVRNKINNNFDKLHDVGLFVAETNNILSAQTINNTYTKISLLSEIAFNFHDKVSLDEINNKVIINEQGIYKFTGNANLEGGTNERLQMSLFVNGFESNIVSYATLPGSNKKINIAYHGIMNFEAGDYLEIYAKVESSSDNIIIHSASVAIEKTIY